MSHPAPIPAAAAAPTGATAGARSGEAGYALHREGGGAPPRDLASALRRGFAQRCPACGTGAVFGRYLKPRDACPDCGEALHHHRADDAPPYFTILVVGHVVIPLVLAVEQRWAPPEWVYALLFLPLTLGMALMLLPRIKGALIGLQWALYMHGFCKGLDAADADTARRRPPGE